MGESQKIVIEKVFPATDEAFVEASAFVEETMEELEVGMKASMQLSVAFEEIFVNVAHYAYPGGTGEVRLLLEKEDNILSFSFIDSGIPFDPLAKPDPDITLAAEDRRIGGLGIYMVKKSMDDVRYRYENGQNIFTMIKKV